MSAFIYQALRTARARAKEGGSLAGVSPAQMVAQLVGAMEQSGLPAKAADQLILGCVGQVKSQGGNIALVSKLMAGLSHRASAVSLNHFCASGLTSIGLAANACMLGQSDSALAGGVESMSQVPFLGDRATYYTDTSLPVRERFIPVAVAADLLATQYKVSREALNEVSLRSQHKAAAADGYQQSRISVLGDDGQILLDRDECVRGDITQEALQNLKPAFAELAGAYTEVIAGRELRFLHSIANAPGMVDGAALALIGRDKLVGMPPPRARIIDWADIGADPSESLTGGFAAMQHLLKRRGLKLSDIDRIEFMEAFAVVPAIFLRDYDVDPDRVNVSGGHLAKGHPLGATGAILLSTLLDVLERDDKSLGMVVATGASGCGTAMLVERVN
jgi:acetyl-CoA C-acetyltransferase/acetyl-CoA acyltransferase